MTVMSEPWADRVAASIVRTDWPEPSSGQGFVVAGGYIVTAAHCAPSQAWTDEVSEGELLAARNSRGDTILLRPVFSDPCHDLAVLQVNDEGDSDGLRGIPGLAIQWRISPDFTAGALFTHDRGLVPVSLEVPPVFIGTPRVAFTAEAPINGGTSGGPCLTEKGRVLTPVSFTDSPDNCTGYGAALGVSLPRWLAVEIWRAERDLG
jgi:S1-C subfamily serine protease